MQEKNCPTCHQACNCLEWEHELLKQKANKLEQALKDIEDTDELIDDDPYFIIEMIKKVATKVLKEYRGE